MSSRSPDLPAAFLGAPIAHRGLHDRARGVVENSRAAAEAAIAAGYGIELDVQLTADGEAMVFHDDAMPRLTGEPGLVRDYTAAALGRIALPGGGRDRPDPGRVPRARRRPGAAPRRDQGPGRRPRPRRRPAGGPGRGAPRRLSGRRGADVLQPALGRGLRDARARPAAGPDHLRLRHRRLVAAGLPPGRARRARRRGAHRRRLRLPRPHRSRQPGARPAEGGGLPILTWTVRSAGRRRPRPAASPTTSPSRATAPRYPVDAAHKTPMSCRAGDWHGRRGQHRDHAFSAGSTRSRPPTGTPAPAPCAGERAARSLHHPPLPARARDLGLGRPRQRLDRRATSSPAPAAR